MPEINIVSHCYLRMTAASIVVRRHRKNGKFLQKEESLLPKVRRALRKA